ncbi:MAG: MATE family efflux transporter [Bacteroidota bacterium]|nr:MATE family efflux transporter [Bacteroidota bacterium]
MGYAEHFRRNIILAYPVMLSQLGHIMVGVADSIMVGRLGAGPLAAVSLGNSLFNVALMFGIGISYAITPLVALADGEGQHQKSSEILKHGFVLNLVTGVLLFLILMGGSYGLYYLNQPAEVVRLAIPYFIIISISLIPFMAFQSYKQFAEGLSITKQAMYIIVVSNLLNILLNYILIFGKWGGPALGLNGAGWATLISRIILFIIMAVYVHKSARYIVYVKNFFNMNLSRKVFEKMLKIGLPTGMQFIFEVGAFSFAAIMIGWLGATSLAAHQIALNMAAVSYMMATGISAAATVRVGNQLGRKDFSNMRAAGFSGFIMGGAFMAISCLIFIVGKNYLPSLYINEADVIQVAASLLVIAAFFQISDGVQVVGLGALRGMGDVKVPTLITLVAYWVLGLPIGYLLSFEYGLGPEGIWYGLLIGLSSAAILLLSRFHVMSRRKLQGV